MYVSTYKLPNDNSRKVSLAGINKMNFIIELINRNGFTVDIYSVADSNESRFRFRKGEVIDIGNGNQLYQTPILCVQTKFLRKINLLFSWIWLIGKLMRTDKYTTILVYHKLQLITPLLILKKIKKVNYILEVEELYSKMPGSLYPKDKELRFIYSAQGYIFVSELLKKEIAKEGMVIYGNYGTVKGIKKRVVADKINLLFSGTIDEIRGVFEAVKTMEMLPSDYVLNISGTGDLKCIEKLKTEIREVNRRKGYEACVFWGKLSDEVYYELMCSSHIALNTQIDGEYSEFLFPSKIVNYLRVGLPVVTTPGLSIVNSCFSKVLIITKGYEIRDIAEAILKIDHFDNVEGYELLNNLYQKATSEINELLK